MAKPPIIISNGGIVGSLARGIDDPDAESKIMNNLAQLNEKSIRELEDRSIAKWMIGDKHVPMIFWCLNTDDIEYQLNKLRSILKDKTIELGPEIEAVPYNE